MKLLLLLLAAIQSSTSDLLPPLPASQVAPARARRPITQPILTRPAVLPAQPPVFTGSTIPTLQTTIGMPLAPLTLPIQPAQAPFRPMPAPRGLSQLSSPEIQNILNLHERFVDPNVVDMHFRWHEENGQGGTFGPGSGEAVQVMHDTVLNRVERLGGLNFKMPPLMPGEIIPEALSIPGVARSIGAIPDYLTVEGGILPGSDLFVSLNTIDTLDKLGRVMSRAHREKHLELGGDMADIRQSIRRALFWPLHALFRRIREQWLQTPFGQTWAAKNPNHAIFHLSGSPASYTNAFFANGDHGCYGASLDPLCIELARWDQETAASLATATGNVFTQPLIIQERPQPLIIQERPMIREPMRGPGKFRPGKGPKGPRRGPWG